MRKLVISIIVLLFGLVSIQAQSVNLDGAAAGNQDCMTTGDLSGDISNTYTVEAWVYPTELDGTGTDQSTYGYTVMASSFTPTNGYSIWITLIGSEVRVFTYELTATAYHESSGAGIVVNNWTHIAVSATKAGTTTLYVNGSIALTYTNDGDNDWDTVLTIGALRPDRTPGNIPFYGLMDEVRVWNDIRTQTEIQNNMYNEIDVVNPTAKQGLVGYWTFNDSTDPTEDLSDNNNDGDLIQGATFGVQNPNLDPPLALPVELSSLTAHITNDNFVGINWITQSETNVSGYYVYRATEENVNSAILVSPLIPAKNQSSESEYSFIDYEVGTQPAYFYWLQDIGVSSDINFHGPVAVFLNDDSGSMPGAMPALSSLNSIYPNPLNPTATISYSFTNRSNVKISIFNLLGKLILTWEFKNKDAGNWNVLWDGEDSYGRSCESGVYFVKLQAGNESYTRKAIIMK